MTPTCNAESAAHIGKEKPMDPREKTIDTMNDLIKLDLDAVSAYTQAIEACQSQEIKLKLEEFREDHQRHVVDLSAQVRVMGGEPATSRDIKGFLIEAFTAITSHGDRSAILAMRGNEELTNRYYASALDKDLPVDVRNIVERNYEDEKKHLSWIKGVIASRAWEKTGKAA
jgi:uncharacterized protein (TIGR02284 family)